MLMMIRESLARSLPEPDFIQRGGEFTSAIWRDWLTDKLIESLGLNDRQISGLKTLKVEQKSTTMVYQKLVGCSRRTSAQDLDDMLSKWIIQRQGAGRSAYYVYSHNRAINLPIVPSKASSELSEDDASNRAVFVPNVPPKKIKRTTHTSKYLKKDKMRT